MGTQQGGAEVRSDDRAPTLTAAAGMSGNNQPNNRSTVGPDKPCSALHTFGEVPAVCYQMQGFGDYREGDVASNCAKRISAQYLRPVTMGSLFDGIGGFPLVFERHNGKGTARWASEIEEFPIAVTKLRFGEDA